MSNYVMSDIHGEYDLFIKMMELIKFSDKDNLYITGDVIDRGEKSVEIIKYIMQKPNISCIAGNHEVLLLQSAGFLLSEVTEANIKNLSEDDIILLADWLSNGGEATLKELAQLNIDERKEIIEYISDFDLYKEISVCGKNYVLVHSGLGNFEPDKHLWEYTLDDFVWTRPDFNKGYYDDKTVIVGHTPTQAIQSFDRKGYIFFGNNLINIDCGCVYKGGRLACLRLEDMEEFYIEKE